MKTVIITGGSSGLGFATAKLLMQFAELHIVIASRNPHDATRALQQQSPNITAMPLDLSSLADVARFAEAFADAELPPLYAIVANAALAPTQSDSKSVDGFDLAFAVNHLGHFALVHRLLSYQPQRLVIVSSQIHVPEDWRVRLVGVRGPLYTSAQELAYPTRRRSAINRYAATKVCNLLFAYELMRRYPALPVLVLHPGFMADTGLSRDYSVAYRAVLKGVSQLMRPFVGEIRHSRTSAKHLMRLILDPSVERGYFDGYQQMPSSIASYDTAKARELWECSAEWTGLGE